MFVQWKQKKLRRKRGGKEAVSLRAVLVKSQRVNGKPTKQEMYLGSIRQADVLDPKSAVKFWTKASQRLGHLVPDHDIRVKLRSGLAAVVPDPVPVQVRRAAATLLRRNSKS